MPEMQVWFALTRLATQRRHTSDIADVGQRAGFRIRFDFRDIQIDIEYVLGCIECKVGVRGAG